MNVLQYLKFSSKKQADRVGLVIDEKKYTYGELSTKASQLIRLIADIETNQIGIFVSRSLKDYTGILAALACGKPYIPLNIKYPSRRNQTIIRQVGITLIITGKEGLRQVQEMTGPDSPRPILVCPELEEADIPSEIKKRFQIFSNHDLIDQGRKTLPSEKVSVKQNAYITFTSGSTGTPKGIPITHHNIIHYINYLKNYYDFKPDDRFSQYANLSFDLSVHNLFLCWNAGAALYVIPESQLFAPANFIKRHQLTVWTSTPAAIVPMKKLNMLKDKSFTSLRYSFFCGDPLSKNLAVAWQNTASNAELINLYGPAETTVSISHYKLPKDPDKIKERNGIVSIGTIFKTQNYCLIDKNNAEVKDQGELCLDGTQVFSGYWSHSEENSKHFFKFPDQECLWFKTGDIVRKEEGLLFYISRKDHMVKIGGARVELEEINHLLKKITRAEQVYSIPYPVNQGIANHIYTFINAKEFTDKTKVYKTLKKKLPVYMIPKDIIFLTSFPLSPNDKIDRKQLIDHIKT